MATTRTADRMWAVAIGAGLWGTSALMRDPLSQVLPAPTIVLYEHAIITLLLAPWIAPALRALLRAGPKAVAAMVVVGGGSSVLATTLFTAAFAVGDPITPQVLQKLQPLLGILLAVLLLGERLSPRYAGYALPAIAGTWILAFPDPWSVSVQDVQAAGLALGAALLWASGTVLGRIAGVRMSFMHVTAVRFTLALPVALLLALGSGSPVLVDSTHLPMLAALAIIPGLLALSLYYWGLSRTPASRATLAELSFPLVSALVGVTVLGAELSWSQWIGAGTILACVTVMALSRSRERPTGVAAPASREPELS